MKSANEADVKIALNQLIYSVCALANIENINTDLMSPPIFHKLYIPIAFFLF